MRLSVALCTYNGAGYLAEQLASIASQSRLPDELVVCDDGSTDATPQLVARFAADAPFAVRLEANPQRLGSTQNFARSIALCRGDWIALADQDDRWHANKLATLVRAVEQSPAAAIAFSDAALIDAAGQPLGQRLWEAVHFSRYQRRRAAAGRLFDVLLRHNVVTGATMMFDAALSAAILPIPPGWVHDGWIALLAAALRPAAVVDAPLVDYRQHPAQQIGERRRSLAEHFRRGQARTADYYAAQAAAYRAAAERLATLGAGEEVVRRVQSKAEHLQMKAHMRQLGRGPRLLRVAGELVRGRYRRYTSGWRSLAQDLFC